MNRRGAILVVVGLVAAALNAPAAAQRPSARVVRDPVTTAPVLVSGIGEAPRGGGPVDVALNHLMNGVARYHIPARELEVLEVVEDDTTTTVRFAQRHRGVPVFGARYLVHMRRETGGLAVETVNGHFFTDLDAPEQPRVAAAAARELATAYVRPVRVDRVQSHGLELLPFGRGVLTHHMTVTGDRWGSPAAEEVFVNAVTGGLALRFNALEYAAATGTGTTAHGNQVALNLFGRNGRYEMRDQSRVMFQPASGKGQITTHDVEGRRRYRATAANISTSPDSSVSGRPTNSGAVDAHWGAGMVYEYYRDLGRNSIDDRGMTIKSTAAAGDSATGGPLFNAFWDGRQMVYGNPDPSELYPLSADLDVVAHELTHGVTEHSGDLLYLNQSGAMNEAYSDYFGNALDVDVSNTPMGAAQAGYIGEDLCKVANPTNWRCPLRDMNDGRDTTDAFLYLIDIDNGGVHDNSTVYSGALWNIRERLGAAVADEYIYKALNQYTTPLDDFVDGRAAVIEAARASDASTAQLDVIRSVFDRKGIVRGWETKGFNSDARTLVKDVTDFPGGGVSGPPAASGRRFIVGSYRAKRGICCKPLPLLVGRVSGRGRPVDVGDASAARGTNNMSPDISGRKGVWAHLRVLRGGSVDLDVHLRKLGGRVREVVDARGAQWFPSIDGRAVAWEDTRGGDTNIWARRIGRTKPAKVTGAAGEQWVPQVSGNWVAWWDLGNVDRAPRIRLENLATGRKVTIRSRNGGVFIGPPALGPRHVVWFQDRNDDGRGSIRKAKLGTSRKKTVVGEGSRAAPFWSGLAALPVVSANGEFVSYTDEIDLVRPLPARRTGRDVWIAPLGDGRARRVTSNRGDQAYPSTARRRVLWLDAGKARTDLVSRRG